MKRVLIIAIASICFVLLVFLEGRILGQYFDYLPWENSRELESILTLLPVLLLMYFMPGLRDVGSLKLRWTWVGLIPLSFLAVNVIFLNIKEVDLLSLSTASLIIGAIITGVNEELFFRGFCFIRNGELTPKTTVLLSSSAFAFLHLLNYCGGEPIGEVIGTVLLAFSIGLAFGIIRIASGSISFCILMHALINATFSFADNDNENYSGSALLVVVLTAIIGFILLFTHRKMRVNKLAVDDFASPVVYKTER